MKKIIQIVFIVTSLIFLSGCASMGLPRPVPKHSRVGILVSYDKKADFKHIGTTLFQDTEYWHALPNFHVSEKIIKNVSHALKQNGYRVVVIKGVKIDQKKWLIQGGLTKDSLTDYTKKLLKQTQRRYPCDYLLIIHPGIAIFGDGENPLMNVEEQGVFYRSFFGIKRAFVAAGFGMILLKSNSDHYLTGGGQIQKRINPKLWKDRYDQISRKDLQYIVDILEKELPVEISKSLKKMMWLN